jgi:hypothetical protein
MSDARKKAEEIAEMAMENWRCGREYFPFNDDVKALSDLFQDLITAAIEAERKTLAHWKAVANYYRPHEQKQNEAPCAICYHMFAPEFLEENTCSLCMKMLNDHLRQRLKDAEKWMRHAGECEPYVRVMKVCTCGLDDFRKEK